MFKKDSSEQPTPAQSRPEQPMSAGRMTKSSSKRSGEPATIGPSITIKGDVTGDEDLVIQGKIDGKVDLAQHNVTIGPEGRVKADVFGRSVIVEGEVTGDLRGTEQIILRHSANVQGNINAPRVALEDGATFRGGIEMDASGKRGASVVDRPSVQSQSDTAGDKNPSSKVVTPSEDGKESLPA
jgi:cytoskeletal protein CcmA (bactofilin family)